MSQLAAEAVFAGAVVVVQLDEGLRGVGIGAREVERREFCNFAVALGFELMQEVEGALLQVCIVASLSIKKKEWHDGVDDKQVDT